MSAITQFVPRVWWPEKFDTGGVVLTKEYTGDAWDGASNLATGLYPEAIINFGVVGGIVFATIQFILLLIIALKLYLKIKFSKISQFKVLSYIYTIWGIGSLITGEFTNIVVTILIYLVTIKSINIFSNITNRIKLF